MFFRALRVGAIYIMSILALAISGRAVGLEKGQAKVLPEHEREELGINQYTAPSVAEILRQLEELRPLPFDELKRDLPTETHSSREHRGLIFGSLIADGFLVVQCQKQNLVEDLGRVLLREARGLGVGDQVMRHSASLTEHGKQGNWPAVRRELIATQTDVEQAMIALRDQKMAHLISLGGWLRGLEITSGAVESSFTAERAVILWQPDLSDYFGDELKTLPPSVAKLPFFQKLETGVGALRSLLDNVSPDKVSLENVKVLHSRARELNLIILTGE